ncbi:hypothetical protein K1T71_010655 [Dendrolimus kikuchii]|uniref:Uncharacterized protein n=1 Tax=Dendrolimus kikuchii TaxID=765133 RepID=A0ACC1CPJ1_9NEOP|nr:hypothetical protein K1T71_010655 [Dendrolimus kikuchii]
MFMFLLFTIFAAASGFLLKEGSCPSNIDPINNFDFDAFSGVWYDYANYPPTAAGVGKCGKISYTKEGETIKVWNGNVVDGVQRYVDGVARFASSEKVGDFFIKIQFGENPAPKVDNDLQVIATDYKNYAVLYTCTNILDKTQSKVSLWVATRTTSLASEPMKEVTEFLKSKGFDTSKLVDGDFSEEACKFTSTSRIEVYP